MRRFAAAAPPTTQTPAGSLASRRAGAWNQSSRLGALAGPEPIILDDGHVLLERDVGVVVRDGVRLSVDVYRPNRPGRFPAILEHIPYRKDDLRAIEDRSQNTLPRATPASPACGSTCVAPAARTGIADDEYTEAEQRDGYDVVAWMAQQPWCTGAVASWGVSYGGFACIQLAALRPPALRRDRAGLRDGRPLHRRHALPRRCAQRQQPARLSDLDDRDERAAAAGRARRRVRRGLAAADRGDAGVGGRVDPPSSTTARTGATARCAPTTGGSCARC